MAWDEWEQLKANAQQRGDAKMQLNQLADPGGGGGGENTQGDLTVDFPDLAAIGDAAYRLRTRMDRESDHARISSMNAAGGLKAEFAIGKALDHVAVRWVDQVQSLLDACAHISNHLDYTKGAHKGDEEHIYGVISSISTLDKGFDEKRGN
ncbi:hypothetical protein ACFVTY_15810 [Streptomyces sp. NPDC058067]|uniref:AG1 protein n=1 Tax=Streptomyces antnestii TaxID=2494256 RepID=A0A3S2W0S5_9ACTN|nr:hypothetical protein [Streptomyces sp. San01]RVU22483.1 hypothetical protein EOT10_21180 [Streptomyces sp. San01]